VKLHFALPVAERSVAGVGCVRHAGMRFKGEQIRQVCFERTVSTAQSPVSVLPFSGLGGDGFFLEERSPPFVPGLKFSDEACGGHLRETKRKETNLLCGNGDCIARNVLLNGLYLMELAELDGKVGKEPPEHGDDALASIDDEAREAMMGGEQGIQRLFVVHDLLRDDLFPVQIPALGAAHEDAVAVSEERGVHGNEDFFRFRDNLSRYCCMSVEVLAQGLRMLAILSAQLRVGLLVRRIFLVGFCDPCISLAAPLLELLPAIAAFVPLLSPAFTVFLCAVRSSSYSAKLALKTGKKIKEGFQLHCSGNPLNSTSQTFP